MTPAEEQELRGLVVQAFDLRDSPYFFDACAAIVDWHERRPLARLERCQERQAELSHLLHETDPARIAAQPARGEARLAARV